MTLSSSVQEPDKSRADEAADWFLRMQEGTSEEELREWMQWCADAENLREYERVRNVWQGVGRLDCNAFDLPQQSSPSWNARRRVVAAVAAVALLAVTVGGLYRFDMLTLNKRVLSAEHMTNESATLPDGSLLTLAPHTDVAVDFSGAVRSLDLAQGEAYFKVKPDKLKPFIVQTAGFKVTAVGTAFSVKSESQIIEVTVEEGVVEASNGAAKWRVGAGYRISYDVTGQAARIASVDAARELAWREGRLEYFMEPLGHVVADANRYSNKKIRIEDPRVEALTYTGTIFTASIEDWLLAVENTFSIDTVSVDDHVVLRSRVSP